MRLRTIDPKILKIQELKSKTGCPNDDVDRFLEFAIGKWSD